MDEQKENIQTRNQLIDSILSYLFLILVLFSLFFEAIKIRVLVSYFQEKSMEAMNLNIISPEVNFDITADISQVHNICYTFDHNILDRVLISVCSIIKFNPNSKFNFYFVIPPNQNIDLDRFTPFLNDGSKIYIRYYEEKHVYMPKFNSMYCRWPKLIIAKLWLHEILSELDEVLSLDSDTINITPLDQLWMINLTGKTFAGATKTDMVNRWINSGVIFYNLKELRKKNQSLWDCADEKICCIDDLWHTNCHPIDTVYDLPLRFNLDFDEIKMYSKSSKQIEEEENACIIHLKDHGHQLYELKNRRQIPYMRAVLRNKEAIIMMEKLFDIKESIEMMNRDN